MWNKHVKRQYCMFLNLRTDDSAQQIGAHVSHVGGPTEGFKYCMDAALGDTPVPFDQWACIAIDYDGQHARAFLTEKLDTRAGRNPYHYPRGLFDARINGTDFTVNAIKRPLTVETNPQTGQPLEVGHIQANCFRGLLGGVAIYGRILTQAEHQQLASVIAQP